MQVQLRTHNASVGITVSRTTFMASTSVDKSHCFDAGNYTTSAAFLGQAGTERDEDFGSIGTAAGFTDR